MHDEIVKRYTRQMILPDIGQDGQSALQEGHVFIVGLGGLGSPAALYLAAAGVGTLTLNDFDRVDLSNLHRQILFDDSDIGKNKTATTAAKLGRLYPPLNANAVDGKLDLEQLSDYCTAADVVLDCSDNFQSRHLLNQACVNTRTPLVSGAAIRLEGQVAVFNNTPKSPCYACLYPEAVDQTERCSEVGVIGPLVGVIGSMQALEAIKILTAEIGRASCRERV